MDDQKRLIGTLHFICGQIGAGKTTLARQLSEQQNAVMICEDQWLALLFDGAPTLEHYLVRRTKIRAVLESHVPDLLRRGISVVFDFAGNTERDRKWIRSLFEAVKAPHLLHLIEADNNSCKRRLAERNQTKPLGIYWGHVTDEQFDQMAHFFTKPQSHEGFIIKRHPGHITRRVD